MAVSQQPASAEVVLEDDRGLARRFTDWLQHDAPSWLISLVLHMTVLIIVGVLFGRNPGRKVVEDVPTFDAANAQNRAEEEVERFDVGKAPLDPTELTTESLTMKDAGQAQQEALFYDDSKEFEEQGGGSLMGKDTAAGGLGFNFKANGLGPMLSGGGGADLGKGAGTGFGKGGEGMGFGGRGRGSREALLGRFGGTKQTERAVAGALNWLARHQNPDGSWSVDKYHLRCKGAPCGGMGSAVTDAGGTALGLLPFLAAGQTHMSRGPYKQTIAKGVEWLIRKQKKDGDLSAGAQGQIQMYAHGLAAIAMCEAYGMTGDPKVLSAAQLAIQFTLKAQNTHGGWRYQPGGDDSDTSVYGWHMMALKSGLMAGLSVDPAKLDLARKWLDTVTEGATLPAHLGQFSYRAKGPPTPCMTAVALLIMQYMGARENDPQLVNGVKYLMANPPSRNERNVYYWYYATQVLHNMCGPDWDRWNRQMRRILVEDQVTGDSCAAGSWDPDKPEQDTWGALGGGRLMVTSLSTLTLEVYYRYLPLYKLDAEGKKLPAAAQGHPAPALTPDEKS
jgi:hypothetical protein